MVAMKGAPLNTVSVKTLPRAAVRTIPPVHRKGRCFVQFGFRVSLAWVFVLIRCHTPIAAGAWEPVALFGGTKGLL